MDYHNYQITSFDKALSKFGSKIFYDAHVAHKIYNTARVKSSKTTHDTITKYLLDNFGVKTIYQSFTYKLGFSDLSHISRDVKGFKRMAYLFDTNQRSYNITYIDCINYSTRPGDFYGKLIKKIKESAFHYYTGQKQGDFMKIINNHILAFLGEPYEV